MRIVRLPQSLDDIRNELRTGTPPTLLLRQVVSSEDVCTLEIVTMLLSHGADARDKDLTRFAAGNGPPEVLELLIRQGADVLENADLAIYQATVAGRLDNLRVLFREGVRPEAGTRAINRATLSGLTECRSLLESAGCVATV